MHCKNCKFWGKYRKGQCDRVDSSPDFEIWVKVQDDSGLSVGLITGPDFGCIYFTSKAKKG